MSNEPTPWWKTRPRPVSSTTRPTADWWRTAPRPSNPTGSTKGTDRD